MNIIYSCLSFDQFKLNSHCLSAQEIWKTLNALYGQKVDNCSKPAKINSDSNLCLTGLTDDNSDGSTDGDSTGNEVENFSYEDLVYFCADLTKSVDKLQSKNKFLKSWNSELTN